MMYPDPSNLDDPAFYLCIDFKNPELVEEINVPVYPKVEETICIFGADNQNWFGLVQQVDCEARTVTVKHTTNLNYFHNVILYDNFFSFSFIFGLDFNAPLFWHTQLTC